MKTHRLIRSDEWIVELLRTLNIDHARVRRVIIDAKVGQVPILYIEHYGDTRMLDVETSILNEVIIRENPNSLSGTDT